MAQDACAHAIVETSAQLDLYAPGTRPTIEARVYAQVNEAR
jgi:hypothetical protein